MTAVMMVNRDNQRMSPDAYLDKLQARTALFAIIGALLMPFVIRSMGPESGPDSASNMVFLWAVCMTGMASMITTVMAVTKKVAVGSSLIIALFATAGFASTGVVVGFGQAFQAILMGGAAGSALGFVLGMIHNGLDAVTKKG